MSSVFSDVRPARLVERDVAPSAPMRFSLWREERGGEAREINGGGNRRKEGEGEEFMV
jgi:hypothetical protein